MIINGSDKIDEAKGDYVVLVDYRSEGLSIVHQTSSLNDALRHMTTNSDGHPMTLLKLVQVDLLEAAEKGEDEHNRR